VEEVSSLPKDLSLTKQEIAYVRNALAREPNVLEWFMIDAEWSEHCSYKSSRVLLDRLPTRGNLVIQGPGYDSGVLDIGHGYVLTAHIESHNHPSAVDPYGGAATGVGGVIRDVLCVGTRPIALLDMLRFGPIETSSHSRWLLKNVVRGIADYGNCTGIPTVGGEVEFDESFERNCLVDVACVGVGRKSDLVLAEARNPRDTVILVGGSTGRDGIHGVTFASKTLAKDSDEDRPAVQIPDPFMKKLIIEATLEAIKTGCVRGLKDLGGGGLTCASSEMAAKAGRGMEIDVSKVHLREVDMSPIEVMISESQERMLFIVEQGNEERVEDILSKYGVPYARIGKVREDGDLVVRTGSVELARLPATLLATAPIIPRQKESPKVLQPELDVKSVDLKNTLIKMLSSPNIASKSWIFTQYDHEVGARTVVKPGEADAAVIRLPNGRFAALKADGNSEYCSLNPREGVKSVFAEACRNVSATGAKPIAMLDHLQFGDPNDPEVFWSFEETVDGLAETARCFETPCIGGKVSFYNEDERRGKAIKPSPVVLVIGLIEDERHITRMAFRSAGDSVVVIGKTHRDLGGSEFNRIHGLTSPVPPRIDLDLERRTTRTVLECIEDGFVRSCHDCSRGGLAVAISEMAVAGNIGAQIDLDRVPSDPLLPHELLFSESNSRFILTTEYAREITSKFERQKIPCSVIGTVGGYQLYMSGMDSEIYIAVSEVKEVYERSFERLIDRCPA
jgi:phosphoribosylformylglycinamidine synthase